MAGQTSEAKEKKAKLNELEKQVGYLEMIPNPVMTIDEDYNVLYLNRKGCEIAGDSLKNLKGKKCYDLFKTPHCNTENCNCRKAMAKDQIFQSETAVDPDGLNMAIRYFSSPMKDDKGNIVGAMEEMIDISSDQKVAGEITSLVDNCVKGDFDTRADISLFDGTYKKIVEGINQLLDVVSDKLFLYEASLDALPFPVSVTDNDMNWLFFNKAVADLTGLDRNEMLGKHCSAWNADICNTERCGIASLGRGDTTSFFKQPGQDMDFRVDTQYIIDRNGNTTGHIEVIQDITAENRMKEFQQKEVDKLSENLTKLAKGDLSIDATVEEADKYNQETRELFVKINDDLKMCVDAVKRVIKDGEMLTEAGKREDFDTRADSEVHQGDFRKIIDGFNTTLDIVADKLFLYEASLDSLPFPVSVTDNDMNWVFFNKAVADLTGLDRGEMLGKHCSAWNADICNTERCGIASLGRGEMTSFFKQPGQDMDFRVDTQYMIDRNGNTTGHIEVIQDITAENRVKEFQQREVDRLSENLTKLATGDFNVDTAVQEADKYNEETRELFVKINDDLKLCVNSITGLVSEVDLMTKSAVEGRLNSRGDVEKFQGDFTKIIGGVNNTLDAILEPITEAQSVLVKLAKGDLSTKVMGQYQGDHALIKDSLNTAIDTLNNILMQVAENSNQVASASTELSASATQIATGSEEQTAQTSEVATAIEEMSATITEVAKNASIAAEESKSAMGAAQTGGDVVGQTIEGMNHIAATVTDAANTITELGNRADEIGEIVGVVDDIADQTNLLALNAAIEAARAGEHGRGFAVVADEVRKLAEKTSDATKEVAKVIKAIQKETSQAVQAMETGTMEVEKGTQLANEAGNALAAIVDGANRATEMVIQIAAAAEQQSSAAEEISRNVDGITAVARQSAVGSAQSADAAKELMNLAERLQSGISEFTLLDN